MAMPTPPEIAVWNAEGNAATIVTLTTWAGIAGDPAESLLQVLGATRDDRFQALAYLPMEGDEALIDAMRINGVAPLPLLRAKVRRVLRAARFALDVLPAPAAAAP